MESVDSAAFDRVMADAGIEVAPDRRDGAFWVFNELARMSQILRQKRAPENEPASIFRVSQVES